MTGFKKGGIILTGIGAYLIIGKAINAFRSSVKNVTDAVKWNAYYKSSKEAVIPPGYEIRPAQNDSDVTEIKKNSDSTTLGTCVGQAVAKAIDSLFDTPKRENDPLEGQTEASESDISEETEEEEKDEELEEKNEDSDPSFSKLVWRVTCDTDLKNNDNVSVAEETSPKEEGDDIS